MNKRALLVAVVAAFVGFTMLNMYMGRFEKEALGGEPVPVLMAVQDIPLGTVLSNEMLGVRAIPARFLEERHVKKENLERIIGVRVSSSVKANEALLWTDLASGAVGQRRIEDFLQPGTRGVTVPVDKGASALLSPGQRIDISLTKLGGGEMQNVLLMQNLIVIAVGGSTENRARGSNMITVAVSPRQASFLMLAGQTGSLTATLRNNIDFASPDLPPVPERSLIEQEQIRTVLRRAPSAPTPRALPGRI